MQLVKNKRLLSKIQVYFTDMGFTLIEILVAMFVLVTIVVAFTPLLLGSFDQIMGAGEKSDSLFKSQKEMSEKLSQEEIYGGGSVPIRTKDGAYERDIWGGIVKSGDFVYMLPLVQSINLEPKSVYEGYKDGKEIKVIGKGVDLDGNNYKIFDSNNDKVDDGNLDNDNNIILPSDDPLTNAKTDYVVKIEVNDERLKSKFKVKFPWLLAAGEHQSGEDTVRVSQTGDSWVEREDSIIEDINHITYGAHKKYIAVGDNGGIYVLEDEESWKERESGTDQDLNHVIWTGNNFFAVGDEGTIVFSESGDSWNQVEDLPDGIENRNLNGITFGGVIEDGATQNRMVVVGEEGVILTHDEEEGWNIIDDDGVPTDEDLNAVSAAYDHHEEEVVENNFIIVGNEGKVLKSSDGFDWEVQTINDNVDNDLNAIIFHSNQVSQSEEFFAVGEGEKIFRYDIGDGDWEEEYSTPGLGQDFYDINWGGKKEDVFIAVGSRKIVISSDGENWDEVENLPQYNFKGIAARR